MISPATGKRFGTSTGGSTSAGTRNGAGIRTGARSGIVAGVIVALFFSTAAAESLESFLLPGIDIRRAELDAGKWCRYLVVDEADGISDSMIVYVAVLGTENIDGMEWFWLEFESAPVGSGADDHDVTRVLLSSTIQDLSRGDSLYHYVREMYVRRGTEPVSAADPRDLKRLTLTDPTSDDDWHIGEPESLETRMGPIVCARKELLLEESREIPAGRVKISQYRRDHFVVWTSQEVPIFGLVRCIIERERESKTIPSLPGIPEAGRRTSRVTTVLLGHGDDARPLITIH